MAAAVAPASGSAQASPVHWVVKRDAFADLWYHGLATVGSERFGALPLYSAAHVRASRDAKRRLGLGSPLDASARSLRASLARDSAFEVLHFVPPFFVGEDPGDVLAALRAALEGSPPAHPVSRSLAARAGAVVQSLPSPRQRSTLLQFVSVLGDEWTSFVRSERARWAPSPSSVAALQRSWDDRFAAPLAVYLRGIGRERGIIVVVPAIGAEGRIITDPDGATIVVVSADTYASAPDAPLLAAVRELSFPLLEQLPPLQGASARASAGGERAREAAAVRGGALLLETLAPSLAEPYRTQFTVAGDGRGRHTFDTIYPLDAATESALRELTIRIATPRGSRQ